MGFLEPPKIDKEKEWQLTMDKQRLINEHAGIVNETARLQQEGVITANEARQYELKSKIIILDKKARNIDKTAKLTALNNEIKTRTLASTERTAQTQYATAQERLKKGRRRH